MKRNGYFTFQTMIDIAGAHGTISHAICMGSPVIIKLFTKKVNKQVHEKVWNFQLIYSSTLDGYQYCAYTS